MKNATAKRIFLYICIMKIIVATPGELPRAAREFIEKKPKGRNIVAFSAPMGAGKTTFIAALCRELGVTDEVNSPTFSIINEYRSATGVPIYHFDFYRLETAAEAGDIGLEDYLESGALCLMEWPEIVEPLLPADTLRVEIRPLPDGSREIEFK